jgi:O-methyltransferase
MTHRTQPAKSPARALLRRLVPPMRGSLLKEPWREAYAHSIVTKINLHFLEEIAERIERLGIPGDIVECGVYQGGSAAVLGAAMAKHESDRRLRLFDSFQGFPEASDRDGEYSRRMVGVGASDPRIVNSVLRRAGVPMDKVEIVVGLFEDTFPTAEDRPTALLHVDSDLYEPVRLTFEKFYSQIPPGGFVVINDYGTFKGSKEATDEFLAEQGVDLEPVMIDPGAAFFQKPGEGYGGLPKAGHYPGWEGPVA